MALVTMRLPGFLDAAHGHAEVFGLDDDGNAVRLEDFHDRVGNLAGEALLDLRAAGEIRRRRGRAC